MNVANWLNRTARLSPGADALMTGLESHADYGGFASAARGFGGWLEKRLRVGDRIGIFCENCPDWLVAIFGIWWMGAVAVPINAKLHGREASWILSNAQATLVVTSDRCAGILRDGGWTGNVLSVDSKEWRRAIRHEGREHPRPRADGDLAWLFYTSGTTGRPKGVEEPG